MTKELVISVIIIVVIIAGDIFTTKYTNKSIEIATQSLSEIRKEMEKKKIDFEIGRSLIFDEWNNNKPNEEFEDLFSLIVDFEL